MLKIFGDAIPCDNDDDFKDQDKKEDVVWYGRVVSLKTRTATGDPVIRIAYWKHDENEDNCVDSNILFSKVIADMIYQNLILL